MKFEIRGRKLGENISNHKALSHMMPILESMEGMSAGSDEYHREKDLLEHTLMVYEEMKELDNSDEALLMALAHDFGKIMTQYKDNDAKHDMIGGKMIELLFLDSDVDNKVQQKMVHACEQHLRIKYVTGWSGNNAMDEGKVIKMAQYFDIEGIDIDRMLDLAEADSRGRKPPQDVDRESIKERLELALEVSETVDREYVLEKRASSIDDYKPEAIHQMTQQDMVELMREKEAQ